MPEDPSEPLRVISSLVGGGEGDAFARLKVYNALERVQSISRKNRGLNKDTYFKVSSYVCGSAFHAFCID